MTSRQAWSTVPATTPGRTARHPDLLGSATTSKTLDRRPVGGPPTQNVRVMSER